MSNAFQVCGVTSGYKSSIVLRNLSLNVGSGEVLALLGKNGMGKSTLLKTIMGYLPKLHGSVLIGDDESDASALPPHRIARMGVSYAAQEHALFAELTVYDNLRLAMPDSSEFDDRFGEIEEVFPVFRTRLKQAAGTLSGGEQKMLLVARTLMARPKVILLDEITEGLQPSVIERISTALKWEREKRGTAMLLVEQHIPFALGLADRFAVLKRGEIVEIGDAKCTDAAPRIFEHLRV